MSGESVNIEARMIGVSYDDETPRSLSLGLDKYVRLRSSRIGLLFLIADLNLASPVPWRK